MKQMSDDEMRAHMGTLDDEQLSDFLAAIEAAEIIENSKPLNLPGSALYYATKIGWPVFPLRARGKAPQIPKAHPDDATLQKECRGRCGQYGHGLYDATTDPGTVRTWWERWPNANIGVRSGLRAGGGCGWDVIDVDGRIGLATLATLKHADCPADCSSQTFCGATGKLPPVGARAFTPGDPSEPNHEPGRHLYTPATGSSNTTNAMPGIDLRGDGGYVVVPPSVGPSGARYSWITRPEIVTGLAGA
jgi:hypothetical protein